MATPPRRSSAWWRPRPPPPRRRRRPTGADAPASGGDAGGGLDALELAPGFLDPGAVRVELVERSMVVGELERARALEPQPRQAGGHLLHPRDLGGQGPQVALTVGEAEPADGDEVTVDLDGLGDQRPVHRTGGARVVRAEPAVHDSGPQAAVQPGGPSGRPQ